MRTHFADQKTWEKFLALSAIWAVSAGAFLIVVSAKF